MSDSVAADRLPGGDGAEGGAEVGGEGDVVIPFGGSALAITGDSVVFSTKGSDEVDRISLAVGAGTGGGVTGHCQAKIATIRLTTPIVAPTFSPWVICVRMGHFSLVDLRVRGQHPDPLGRQARFRLRTRTRKRAGTPYRAGRDRWSNGRRKFHGGLSARAEERARRPASPTLLHQTLAL